MPRPRAPLSRRHAAPRRRQLLGEWLEQRCLLASDIQGLVWNDINRNGLLEAGEAGLPATLVELVATNDTVVGNSDDRILSAATTDSLGNYTFASVAEAQYYLRFLRQPVDGTGHRFTAANVGSEDSIDSDVIPLEGRSDVFAHLTSAPTVTSAGLIQEPTNLAFAFPLGGETTQWGKAVVVDTQGNIYVGLRTDSGNIDLDPGTPIAGVASYGFTDLLVAKYNSTGQFLWGRSFGGPSSDVPESLAVDNQGNVYLTGTIDNNSFFGPGPGETTLTGSGQRAFAVKLDPAGNVLWARQSQSGSIGMDISVDAAGSAYVTGSVSFNPMVWKLDTDGSTQWQVQAASGTLTSRGQGIYATETATYVTGSLEGTVDFDPSSGVANLTSSGGDDIFYWRLDSLSGAYANAFRIGGPANDVGRKLSLAPDGSILITGSFTGTVDFDPSPSATTLTAPNIQTFVMKLNPDGSLNWVRTPQGDHVSVGRDIALTASGEVWITGSFNNSPDFDPAQSSEHLLVSNGGSDFYIWNLDASGNLVNAFGAGSAGFDLAHAITLTASADRVLVVGNLAGTADFDPGAGTVLLTTLQTQSSALDGFLWAMATPQPCSTVVENTNDSGTGSLREALNCADGTSDTETITFGGSVFSDDSPDVITLTSGELLISSDLTIEGPGAELLTISGNDVSRVLRVIPNANATVSGLTITGGNGIGGALNGPGGGIYNEGNLTLRNAVVADNSTSNHGSFGGGIASTNATLTLVNSTVAGNTSAGPGGGISNDGNPVVPTNLMLIGSTISGNHAGFVGGGGISNVLGTVTMINSTISGNSTTQLGGAIKNLFGTLIISNSTITANRADSDGDEPQLLAGGGIVSEGAEIVQNSIVAGNVRGALPSSTPSEIEETTIDTADSSLVGDAATSGGIVHDSDGDPASGSNNIVGNSGVGTIAIGGVIGPLADHGGPTQAHKPLAGSLVIGAGRNALIAADNFDLDGDANSAEPIPFDQRGTPFKRVWLGIVDIGSLEAQPPFTWHNFANPFDVRGGSTIAPDDHIDAGDALAIINYINTFGAGLAPENAVSGQPYGFLDTTNDRFVAADDALSIINAINAGFGGEGESNASAEAGSAGNDLLTVDAKVKVAEVVNAGAGNDTVKAGGGPAVLIGGEEQDQLSGGCRSDPLIAGMTADDNNHAALRAVLAEWGSTRSLAVRSENLRSGSGPVLAGLNISLKPKETVLDDSSVDSLLGGGDLDWFLMDAKRDQGKDRAELVN